MVQPLDLKLQTSLNPLDTEDSHLRPARTAAEETPVPTCSAKPIVDFNRFLSAQGRRFRVGELSNLLFEFAGVPGVVGLHNGLPPAAAFPIKGITLRLDDDTTVDINDPAEAQCKAVRSVTVALSELEMAQQYNRSPRGYPPLLQWAQDHVQRLHAPPAGHELLVTLGGNHGAELILAMLLDEGAPFLVEEYTYSHILESVAEPKGYVPVGVPMDRDGILPDALRQVMDASIAKCGVLGAPKVLYVVPVGGNPTGTVTSEDRKRQIYAVAQEYNLLIIEDDPYYLLQYRNGKVPGLQNLGCSFLSLDTDGRVVRLDSVAKWMGPGYRIGWATAAPALRQKLEFAQFAACLGPSSLAQVALHRILTSWGDAGLEQHIRAVQAVYWRRASTLHQAAITELAGVAEAETPRAGMFLWLKLLTVPDSGALRAQFKQEKVVVVPGRISHVRGGDPSFQCPYLRCAWSAAKEEDLAEGMRRVGRAVRRHLGNSSGSSVAESAAQPALNGQMSRIQL